MMVIVCVAEDSRAILMMPLGAASLLVAEIMLTVMTMKFASPSADEEYVWMPATRLSVALMLFVLPRVIGHPVCAKKTIWVTQMTQNLAVNLLIVKINVMRMITAVLDRCAKWTSKGYEPVLTPVFLTPVVKMNCVMSRMADHCAAVKKDIFVTHPPTAARVII